ASKQGLALPFFAQKQNRILFQGIFCPYQNGWGMPFCIACQTVKIFKRFVSCSENHEGRNGKDCTL
ncbi:MAG: hypothetical protein ACLVJX_08690, partial [Merdibacter sp.]